MRPHCHIAILLLLAVLLTGCEHRPLIDPNNAHYIRVYIDEQLRNITFGYYNASYEHPSHVRPTVLRVALCDVDEDRVVAEAYLQHAGSDAHGYYLDGHLTAAPGRYNLMVYNFGTESTQIANEESFWRALAYTNPVASYLYAGLPGVRAITKEQKLVYEPNHLFQATRQALEIPYTDHVDTLRRSDGEWFKATSMVYSYYLQVGVRGIEYVSSSASLMTGLAGSKLISSLEMNEEDPVALFFNMLSVDYDAPQPATTDSEGGKRAILYTTFNTFGKLEHTDSDLQVTFEFVKADGSSQVETIRITPLFSTSDVIEQQWIILDREIVIEPPADIGSGGGFTPDVDEWDDIHSDIPI